MNRNSKLKFLIKVGFITISLSIFLQACLQTPIADSATIKMPELNACIHPPETFAFKTFMENDLPISEHLPPQPWMIESKLPEQPSDVFLNLAGSFIANHEVGQEIWISKISFSDADIFSGQFLVYKVNSKEWTEVSSRIGDSSSFAGRLFRSSNNIIWALNGLGETSTTKSPLLSKYNTSTKRFEFLEETAKIPQPRNNQIILDKNDVFWMFVDDDGIYSYDTVTHMVQKHANLDNMKIEDVKLAPDGSLYFVNTNISQNDYFLLEVYRFTPTLGYVEQIPTYEIDKTQMRPFSNILIDHRNRLWLSDLGWMEPNGIWYATIRSPIFLTNIVWTGGSSRWTTPDILLESRNGILWFRSENGMAWLDPEKGEWCWFTTYQSNIVEDADGNLWMIADGKLYKYPLRP